MSNINQLSAVDSLSDSDLLPVYSTVNGDARKVSVGNLRAALAPGITANDDKTTQYASPSASPFTVSITDSSASIWLKLTPTGTLANGTIKLPAVGNCKDRQEILVSCSQIVTTLTIDGNGATAVTGAPTTLAANAAFRLRFDAVARDWTKVSP